MRPMRLLVAASGWFPDRTGGSARVITDTTRRLAAAGHDITVLAPAVESYPPVESEGTLTIRRAIKRGRLPLTFTDFTQVLRHGRGLRSHGFDLIVSHSTQASCALAAARVAPMVLVYHAPGPKELSFETARRPFGPRRLAAHALKPAAVAFERRAVKLAERLLVLSEFSRSQLVGDYPASAPRVVRVSGGVDTDTFSPGEGVDVARARLGISPEDPLLLTVRRLEPRMGLENLLLAMQAIYRSTGATLVVIGSGSLGEKLQKLSAELNLKNCVRLLGRVPDNELVEWYRAADLFVLPTLAYEGFGMVTAEALASGTPVVGTPVGATPELLEPLDPRLLAKGVEPPALMAAILEALQFSGGGFRERCRAYACERYSWDNVIPRWEAALAAVVG